MVSHIKEATPDREIVSTRLIDAPRELIWQAWTDPEHLTRWWGPEGFSSTFQELNPRPGGVWRFELHGPNGADYKNEVHYVEVEKPKRIVLGPRLASKVSRYGYVRRRSR